MICGEGVKSFHSTTFMLLNSVLKKTNDDERHTMISRTRGERSSVRTVQTIHGQEIIPNKKYKITWSRLNRTTRPSSRHRFEACPHHQTRS